MIIVKQIGRYVIILLVVMILWNTIVIKPLKIFTVFLHELGHALMAVIFGYGIQDFKVNFNESGHTIALTKGWLSSFMISNGGYLGSVLFALLILYLKRTPFKKYILGSLAILFLAVSIKFSGFSFALLFSIIFAAVVLVLYMLQKDKLDDWVIDILGIASIAYAVYDTFVDTILLQINIQLNLIPGWNEKTVLTDAMQLAKMTGIPAIIWGIIWLAVAVIAINAVLLHPGKMPKRK